MSKKDKFKSLKPIVLSLIIFQMLLFSIIILTNIPVASEAYLSSETLKPFSFIKKLLDYTPALIGLIFIAFAELLFIYGFTLIKE